MALAHGDTVIPAGTFVQNNGAANLAAGSILPEKGLVMGTYTGTADKYVVWNDGTRMLVVTPLLLRKVTNFTGTNVLGKKASWPGMSAAFNGYVIMQFDTELTNAGSLGVQEPVVLVQAQGFQYIQKPANLEFGE